MKSLVMTKGAYSRLAPALLMLGLVALLGHFTAGRVEAQAGQPTHQALQDQLNSIETKVDSVQTTVDNIPPAWSQTLPAAERFVLVMGGAAVLDKETGLVWEQSPDTIARDWLRAQFFCNNRAVGGRKGWRLPTIQELASLVDPTQADPALPAGHPFSNVQQFYWSATTSAFDSNNAWIVVLDNGAADSDDGFKGGNLFMWCVRGGHGGLDAQ